MFVKLVYSVGSNAFLFRGYKITNSSIFKTNSFMFSGNSSVDNIETNMKSVVEKPNDYYVKANLKEFVQISNKLEKRKSKYLIHNKISFNNQIINVKKESFLKVIEKLLKDFSDYNDFFNEQYIHPELKKKENLKLLKETLHGKKWLHREKTSDLLSVCEEIKFKFLSGELKYSEELEILAFKYDKDNEICTFY